MIPRKSSMGKKKKKTQKDTQKENVYFDMELEPVEVNMVPDDQLELNDAELDEEFTKTLSSINPNEAPKKTQFNFKSGGFESFPNNDHLAVHLSHEGIVWSTKEEELQKKLEMEEEEENNQNMEKDENNQNETAENDEKQNEDQQQMDQQQTDQEKTEKDQNENANEDDEKSGDQLTSPNKKKKEILVKNQFNYSERASQTFNEPLRDREVQTEPAPKSVFCQNANPASIRDEYLINLLKIKQQKLEEENKKKKSQFGASSDSKEKDENEENVEGNKIKHNDEGDALLHSKEMLKALKIMERVVVLNGKSKSYHDFRYFDESVSKRSRKAFLSHLWTFKYNKIGNKMVTALCWNNNYSDLFAVGYGSYNFSSQTSGMILIYSLKSTVYPYKIILCESGVMSMSFHPKYSSLLCCGSYDGSVCVYDIRNRDDSPIYSSENPESHHSDPVWDIKWYHTELQHELTFYSISSDSTIKYWKMSQNELNHETIISLTNPPFLCVDDGGENDEEDENEEADTNNIASLCSCFDFNPFFEHLYLIGTEDGHIMKCSKTYNDGYIKLYASAHDMNIYCVKWSLFNSNIFLSCSQDWTIKLWDLNDIDNDDDDADDVDDTDNNNDKTEPVITYDLGCAVNDICWSPYSSTIFAAVTVDGKVHIFDLSQNKNYPLCTQKITSSIALTKVSFTVGYPLLIVGDEKGHVYALKLSPNLYLDEIKYRDIFKNQGSTDMFQNDEFREKEKKKLISVLNVTGNKVLDLEQHLSPKKIVNIKSPKNKMMRKNRIKSPRTQ